MNISISLSPAQHAALKKAAAAVGMSISQYVLQALPTHIQEAQPLAPTSGVYYRPKAGDMVMLKPEAWRGYEADEAQDVRLLTGKPLRVVKKTLHGVLVTAGDLEIVVNFVDVVKVQVDE